MITFERIDHVGFTATNLDELAGWYQEVFGMRRVHSESWPDVAEGHPLVLCNGAACVALFAARDGIEPRTDTRADPNEHVALVVDRDNFDRAQQKLDSAGIDYTHWDHGICDSLYLFDPEGHQIEITTYRGST